MATIIYCPKCGTALQITGNANPANMQGKALTCPKCKNKAPFSSYKVNKDTKDEPNTTTTKYGETIPGATKVLAPGLIVIPSLNLEFNLKVGNNIIGRKAQSSSANFQIPCPEKLMSRDHILIEVRKNETTGYEHKLSLNKEHSNATYIGETLLEYGDKIILKDGDTIRLPFTDASRIELQFLAPNPEETVQLN